MEEKTGIERSVDSKHTKESDYVVLKFKRSDLADDEVDLELVQLIEGVADPSFELPTILKWPKGERRNSERALLLLRAGLEHLRDRYPLQKRRQGAQVNTALESRTIAERSPESEQDTKGDFQGW